MKTLEFKTISPFFEQERDGIKPFTIRQEDPHDPRFRALSQQLFMHYGLEIIMFDRRIDFVTPNKVEGSKAWFATAWFTNGLNIGHQLNFVSLVEMKQMAFDFDAPANL